MTAGPSPVRRRSPEAGLAADTPEVRPSAHTPEVRPSAGAAAPIVPRSPAAAPPVALYIHVPFCLSVCPYCDFVVYAGADARGPRKRIEPFLAALMAELDLRAGALEERFGAARPALQSVYLGGGTPSLLPAEAVAAILDRVALRFGIASGAEITLEANPGPADRGDIAGFVAAGVNRLSFGVQSLDPMELRALGRRHSPEDAAEAVSLARAAGVGSLSLDLLYDVPGGDLERWEASLRAAIGLGPDHLSLYALTLDDPAAEGLAGDAGDHLPPSPGALRWRERARPRQDEDRAADQYRLAVERLAAAGFRGYEISNWARPGHESRHNLAYWRRLPHEAAGPGAHAFDGATRRWNAARLDDWLAALLPGEGAAPSLPPGGEETVDAAVAEAESIILALRLDAGVRADAVEGGQFAGAIAWGRLTGLLAATPDGRRLALTTEGRLLSNELFARLV